MLIERYGHTHGEEDIWRLIASGRAQFWPGEASAWLTEFWTAPTGLKTIHGWIAGGDLAEILARCSGLEQYGRQHGAHRAVVTGRKGWIRVNPGYQTLSHRIVKGLT